MTNSIAIYNAETDDLTIREMTASEVKSYEKIAKPLNEATAKDIERFAELQKAKESAKAKLAALGLTEAEIQALTA